MKNLFARKPSSEGLWKEQFIKQEFLVSNLRATVDRLVEAAEKDRQKYDHLLGLHKEKIRQRQELQARCKILEEQLRIAMNGLSRIGGRSSPREIDWRQQLAVDTVKAVNEVQP